MGKPREGVSELANEFVDPIYELLSTVPCIQMDQVERTLELL